MAPALIKNARQASQRESPYSLAWILRPPWPPRAVLSPLAPPEGTLFRRPRCPRGVWILSICPIRLRSKRPCVLDGDENVSRGDGAQTFSPSSGQLCIGFGKPFNLGQRLKEAEKSRL